MKYKLPPPSPLPSLLLYPGGLVASGYAAGLLGEGLGDRSEMM
jgi:hypothetical protein